MPNILELCCGWKSVSRVFESDCGWESTTVDVLRKFKPTILADVTQSYFFSHFASLAAPGVI